MQMCLEKFTGTKTKVMSIWYRRVIVIVLGLDNIHVTILDKYNVMHKGYATKHTQAQTVHKHKLMSQTDIILVALHFISFNLLFSFYDYLAFEVIPHSDYIYAAIQEIFAPPLAYPFCYIQMCSI